EFRSLLGVRRVAMPFLKLGSFACHAVALAKAGHWLSDSHSRVRAREKSHGGGRRKRHMVVQVSSLCSQLECWNNGVLE
ncbi:MAG: hypothetical protein V3W19_15840, partial [Desulfatiglandales bacterium]